MAQELDSKHVKELFSKEYSHLPEKELEKKIDSYFASLDKRLNMYVSEYLNTGKEREYEYGDYSIMLIESLQKVGYLTAVEMLSTYMTDPSKGEAMILRPSYGKLF